LEFKYIAGPLGVLLACLITQAVTIAALFWGQSLAYRRFRHEKLWDLKREVYSKILSKLAKMEAGFSLTAGLYSVPGATDEFRKETLAKLPEIYRIITEIQEILEDNFAILSGDFLSAYQRLNEIHKPTRMENIQKTQNYADILNQQRKIINDVHKALEQQTRKELGTTD
jgi:hypothetical protein